MIAFLSRSSLVKIYKRHRTEAIVLKKNCLDEDNVKRSFITLRDYCLDKNGTSKESKIYTYEKNIEKLL